MSRKFRVLPLMMLIAALGCSNYAKKDYPQLQVSVENQTMPESYEFPNIDPAAAAAIARVEITNTGAAPLVVYKANLVDGGNQYITTVWEGSYTNLDLPLVIEPDLNHIPLWFKVRFDPEVTPVDNSDSTLEIITNDMDVGEPVDCPEWAAAPWNDANSESDVKKPTKCSRMTVDFLVQKTGPVMGLNQSKITFQCVVSSKKQNIVIDNIGTAPLEVTSIDLVEPKNPEITITNRPTLPLTIPSKDDPSYMPITFDVGYDPADENYEDSGIIRIMSNDGGSAGAAKDISVTVVPQGAKIQVSSTNDPFTFLDFSVENEHTLNIYNLMPDQCNDLCADPGTCCGCPVVLKTVLVEPTSAQEFYTVKVVDPVSGNELSALNDKSIGKGKAIDIIVNYNRPGSGPDINANLSISYTMPLSAGIQKLDYPLRAASQCDFEVAPSKRYLSFNAEAPESKYISLINNGNAACQIYSVSIMDNKEGNDDFLFVQPWQDGQELPAFSVVPFEVQFVSHVPDKVSATVTISYNNPIVGPTEEIVHLEGDVAQECKIPVASTGNPGLYDSYKAGDMVVLDACSSSAGTCGEPIFPNGHIWYLMDKPAGSSAKVNFEGACTTTFTADLAGEYKLALMVYDNSGIQSEVKTLTVTVAP